MSDLTPDQLLEQWGKFYSVSSACNNCGWKGEIECHRGTEFSKWNLCPRCGCYGHLVRTSA